MTTSARLRKQQISIKNITLRVPLNASPSLPLNTQVMTPPLTLRLQSRGNLQKGTASALSVHSPSNLESNLERYTVSGNVLTSSRVLFKPSTARARRPFSRKFVSTITSDNEFEENQREVCNKMEVIWRSLKEGSVKPGEEWIKETAKEFGEEAKAYEELLNFLFPEQLLLAFDIHEFGTNTEDKALIEKGNSALFEGRYAESMATYNKMLNKSPLDLLANIGVFSNLYMQGSIEAAYKQILPLLKYYPRRTSLLYNASLCELELKKYEQAASTITKAFISTCSDGLGSTRMSAPRYVGEMYRLRSVVYFQLGYVLLAAKDYLMHHKHKAVKEIVELRSASKSVLHAKVSLRSLPWVASDEVAVGDVYLPKTQTVAARSSKNVAETQRIAELLSSSKNLRTIHNYTKVKDYKATSKKQSIHFPTCRSDKAISALSHYSKVPKKPAPHISPSSNENTATPNQPTQPLITNSSDSDTSLGFIDEGRIEASEVVAKEEVKDSRPKYQLMMKKLDAVQKRMKNEEKAVVVDKAAKVFVDDTGKVILEEAEIKFIAEQLAKVPFIL